MEGKIFKESSNLYQDEAKILFDYYRQAAEKIVKEEEAIEAQIEVKEETLKELNDKLSKVWYWFLTIILFFMYFIKKKELEKSIAATEAEIDDLRQQHESIFRDYKVTKLGVAYVPVADQIKYEDKSFIIDYTGKVENSDVKLQLSRQNDLLIKTIGKLDKLSAEAPIVETSHEAEVVKTNDYSASIQEINQYDYLGSLERSLRTIAYCMDDLETSEVELPLVQDNSQYLNYLKEYTTSTVPQGAPVVEVFDKNRYNDDIEKFREINKLRNSLSTKTKQFEDVLKSLMVTMAQSVQAISELKISSVDKVVLESNKMLYQILKAPYNHYSPQLEQAEIERIRNERFDYSDAVNGYEPFQLRLSSRVKYNLVTGTWTAEDGSSTSAPFGMHQIYEEIVAPVVQNLLMENRIERLRIYNHIKDQKISYLNKWHQDTEAFYRANRAESSDIINLMQESLREYVAAYNTLASLKNTQRSMEMSGELGDSVVASAPDQLDTMATFERQSIEFQQSQTDFEDYMNRLKEDIDARAEEFGYIEYFDAKLRDGYSNALAVATGEVQSMDERRKPLTAVNPLLAKISELPPRPSVNQVTYERMMLDLPTLAERALNRLEHSETTPATPIIEEKVEIETEQAADEAPAAETETTIIMEDNEKPLEQTSSKSLASETDETIEDENEDEVGGIEVESEDTADIDDLDEEDEDDDEDDDDDEAEYEDDMDEDYDEDDEDEEITMEYLESCSDDELKEYLEDCDIKLIGPYMRVAAIKAIYDYYNE